MKLFSIHVFFFVVYSSKIFAFENVEISKLIQKWLHKVFFFLMWMSRTKSKSETFGLKLHKRSNLNMFSNCNIEQNIVRWGNDSCICLFIKRKVSNIRMIIMGVIYSLFKINEKIGICYMYKIKQLEYIKSLYITYGSF